MQVIPHPALICPPRPRLLQAEIDDLARVAWKEWTDALMAHRERPTRETAVAMTMAWGRFVSLFVPEGDGTDAR
jgi:hypothetical protein